MNSLAVEIAAKSQSGAKQFDIRLDPPELGRVEVRLSIDATGKAEAHMTADQPQTLHLLQKDSETLTRALRDAGLDVSQNGLNFSLRGQDRQNGNGQNNSGQGGNFRALQATKVIEAVPTNAIAYSSTGTRPSRHPRVRTKIMGAITSIPTTPTATAGSSTTGAGTDAMSQLSGNFDTFLQLLTTQLKNQDPTVADGFQPVHPAAGRVQPGRAADQHQHQSARP